MCPTKTTSIPWQCVTVPKWYNVTFFVLIFNPFAPGDFAEKRVLKLVEWFSGHCRAIKS